MSSDSLNTSSPHSKKERLLFSQKRKLEEEKKQRLTLALRENLKKRKEQARARIKLKSERK